MGRFASGNRWFCSHEGCTSTTDDFPGSAESHWYYNPLSMVHVCPDHAVQHRAHARICYELSEAADKALKRVNDATRARLAREYAWPEAPPTQDEPPPGIVDEG